jgi:hypothetical protein
MRKYIKFIVVAGALAALAAPSAAMAASHRVTVPNETCRRLDVAENAVAARGLHFVERGGGLFGIIVKSNWVVSIQVPQPGTKVPRGSKVYLYAARYC